jgi:Nuclease-related domain
VRRIPTMWFILARVSTVPGGSAMEGYRVARAGRRRGLARCALLVGLGAVCGWVALHQTGPVRGLAAVASVTILVTAIATWPKPDPERWLRGAAGERATAAILERLPERKWVVMHDLALSGHRANIDHLVIGPSGVWVVDTKTTRAEVRTGWRSVRMGRRKLDAGPTRWEARMVSELLGVPVRPLIVMHAGGLGPRGGRAGRVRVVPPSALVKTLRRGRRRLSRRQVVSLAAEAIEILSPSAFRDEPAGRERSFRG